MQGGERRGRDGHRDRPPRDRRLAATAEQGGGDRVPYGVGLEALARYVRHEHGLPPWTSRRAFCTARPAPATRPARAAKAGVSRTSRTSGSAPAAGAASITASRAAGRSTSKRCPPAASAKRPPERCFQSPPRALQLRALDRRQRSARWRPQSGGHRRPGGGRRTPPPRRRRRLNVGLHAGPAGNNAHRALSRRRLDGEGGAHRLPIHCLRQVGDRRPQPLRLRHRQQHQCATAGRSGQNSNGGERALSSSSVGSGHQLGGEDLGVAEGARREGDLGLVDGQPGCKFEQGLDLRTQTLAHRAVRPAEGDAHGLHPGHHPPFERRRRQQPGDPERDREGNSETEQEQRWATGAGRRARGTARSARSRARSADSPRPGTARCAPQPPSPVVSGPSAGPDVAGAPLNGLTKWSCVATSSKPREG